MFNTLITRELQLIAYHNIGFTVARLLKCLIKFPLNAFNYSGVCGAWDILQYSSSELPT